MISGVDVVIVVADVTAANVVATCVEVVDVVVEVVVDDQTVAVVGVTVVELVDGA